MPMFGGRCSVEGTGKCRVPEVNACSAFEGPRERTHVIRTQRTSEEAREEARPEVVRDGDGGQSYKRP